MTFANSVNLRASLNLDDRFSPGLNNASRALGNFENGLGRVGRGTGQLAQGFARVGAIAGTALVGGIVASVKVAADFEEQLAIINTVAQETPEAIGAIGEGIRRLARETGASLDDLTQGYYDLLSAGIAAADAQDVLTQAQRLGTGSLGTTSEAVDLLTTAINAYNLSADQAATLSNEIAVAVALGKTTLADIAPVYSDVAPLAAIMGIETEELAAAFGTLTAQGNTAGATTTGMRSALRALLEPTAELNALQEELGVNFATLAKDQGLQVALERMFQAVNGDAAAFNALFGRIEGVNFALGVTGTNAPRFNAALDEVRTHVTALDEQVAARRQGLNYQLGLLKANFQDIGITIGSALLPELTPLIGQFGEFLAGKAPDIAQFAKDLAGGIREIVVEVKKTDFSGFLDALRIMAEVGGKVVDLFRSLPPDIQALAITGLALNKLSGGLLGAGVGNIARGLIQVVFQRGTTPANPLWVASVGGVGAGGAAGGAAAGGIAGVLRGVLGVALFTGIAVAIGDFLAQNVTRPANPQRFDFLGAAAVSGNFPSGSQLGVPAALNFAEDLAEEVGLPLKTVQQKIVDSINIRGLTFDQAVAELRGETSTQTRLLTDEQIQTRREIGAGFAASRTSAVTDATQTQQLLGNLGGVTRAGTSALTTRLSVLEGLERGGQGILSTHGATLRGILAKPSEVSVYNTVNVSAPGVATVVNTYTRMRVGGVQADAP